jgi:Tol biopolymer transport system component
MRSIVSALLALTCLLTLAAGASGGQERIAWLTFNEVGQDGHHRRVLSRHDIFPEVSSYSPARRQLAYVPYFYDGARSNKLWVANVDGDYEDRLIFEAPGWITDVAWAPNGHTIAFEVGRSAQQSEEGTWLIAADGTSPRRLAAGGYGLAWSPDSEMLALGQSDTQRRRQFVSVVSVATGATRELGAGYTPQWSPDGTSVLVESGGGSRAIQILPVQGGEPRTVASGFQPAWSPDGGRIAFLRSRGELLPSLWVVSSRGGRPRLLTTRAGYAHYAWSPGSRWIAFQQETHYCGSKLAAVRTDGTHAHRLAKASRIITPLTWSRDGQRVLYVGARCSNQ